MSGEAELVPTVLRPLAATYAERSDTSATRTAERERADPELVRAMPVVLRMEKADPPRKTPLLEAAASAALAVCLDPRSQPGGQWHEPVYSWVSGRIRKVARRARGAHWLAVAELPGITMNIDGAEVRALLPCRLVDTPRQVSRLQISGSELPGDDPPEPAAQVPLLWLNPEVEMTVGKAAAQVGHATMILASLLEDAQLLAWAQDGYRCAIRRPSVAEWDGALPSEDPAGTWCAYKVVAVRDAGFTEVDPGTVTVLARWPGENATVLAR